MKTLRQLTSTALAAGLLAAAPTAAMAQQVTMMTGPQGGVWVPLGGALKNMWEKAVPGLQITSTPGAGIANVLGVDTGKAQIGFANSSSTVDGVAGRPPFKQPVSKVCQMANIYPQYFQVVSLASANVNSFADMKGKSVVTQPKGNTGEMLTGTVLKLNGMDYNALSKISFQASYTDAVSLMKDGHAEVFTLGTAAPASSVMDLASARDIKLVPVDDKTMGALKQANAGYNRLIIKAGTYPKQTEDVPAIGYLTHLVVSCDLPEKLVYDMTKVIATNIPEMASINKSISALTPQMMATDIGVQLHPGAARYYKEVGAL